MKLFESKALDSRVRSEKVSRSEKWFGYLLGPSGMLLLNAVIGGYLNTYYTDVVQVGGIWGGLFLAAMPVFSEILDVITNLIIGQLIERTKTRQGKARPWLLISAPCLMFSGILVLWIPNAGGTVQALWILFSYNLYYAFAYTIYNMSHTLMMPLSTRESKQRDVLAMFNNIGQCIVPGMFVSMMFPMFILPWMGVDQSRWMLIFSVFSIIALPAVLLEYYFTKERVTESAAQTQKSAEPMLVQLKACLKSKYWVMAMTMVVVGTLVNGIVQASRLYYCNWVLGTYNDGWTYTILNVIGQFPLGFGIFLVWPLVKKFGKRNCILFGSVLGLIGCGVSLIDPRSLTMVCAGLIISSFGALPNTYTGTALMADSMDYVEYQHGFRCDGLTASIYGTVNTISNGIASGILNLSLALFSYIPPAADGSVVEQSTGLQNALIFLALGITVLPYLVSIAMLIPYKLEKELPAMRKKMEVENAENHL